MPILSATPLIAPHSNDITVLVRAQNHGPCYLVDCGAVRQIDIHDLKRVGAVFVSHTHFDHWIQFDTVFRHFIGTGKTLRVFGPPCIIDRVQAKLRSYDWGLAAENDFIVEANAIEGSFVTRRARLRAPHWEYEEFFGDLAQRSIFQNERFAIYATTLDHGIPSVAYRFVTHPDATFLVEKSPERPGKWVSALKAAYLENDPERLIQLSETATPARNLFHLLEAVASYRLGVILDHAASTANHQRIEQDFADYDHVLIESYFLDRDRDRATKKQHSYSSASGAVLQRAGVRSATPIHYSRIYDKAEAELLKQEFQDVLNR